MTRSRTLLLCAALAAACSADPADVHDGGVVERDGDVVERDGDVVERDGGHAGLDGGLEDPDATIPAECMPGSASDCGTDREPLLHGVDIDRDGLDDYEEVCVHSTDRCARDTDADGVTDLVEVRGSMTDPLDASSTIAEGDFAVVLPLDGADRPRRTLAFGTSIQRADVYFLLDTTASMQGAIDGVTSSFMAIATALADAVPDAQMGVGQLRDFPFGGPTGYGSPGDAPYTNEQNVTSDTTQVLAALGRLSAGGGGDAPESHVAALFHASLATGATYTLSGSSWTLPPASCPAIPDEPAPRIGSPCFRAGALPIFVMITDAAMHDGPGGANAYAGISPAPPLFDAATSALTSIGARFVGVAVGSDGRAHMEEVARRTGTVDAAGVPLVLDASGGTVSSAVVEALGTLAGSVAQDVSSRVESAPGNPGDTDAARFVQRVTPVEGYRDGVAGAGYASMDEHAFYDVIPGTRVELEVELHNDFRAPETDAPEIHRARIVVIGNGVAELDARQVYVVVPPEGAVVLL